jgi:hypothetical protein
MRVETTDSRVTVTYDSVRELADHAEEVTTDAYRAQFAARSDWFSVATLDEALTLAREGWSEEVSRALTAADGAVEKVERTFEQLAFVAEYGVSGADVDIDRFLTGEPECMVDYPLRPIVKAGRVITVCVSVGYSATLSTETVIKRGHAIAALVLALARLGYATEVWTDWSLDGRAGDDAPDVRIRTLVKGPQDALDAERLMFAVAHPAYKRVLHFGVTHTVPEPFRSKHCRPEGTLKSSVSVRPVEDMSEGTIYTLNVRTNQDIPDADVQLVEWLRQLEIITD